MSYDIALNIDTHDLRIAPNGDIMLQDGADRVAQQVKVTLLTFLGEWFLDTTFGIPYLEDIYVKNPRWGPINTILRQRILAVPGVLRVTRLDLEFDRKARELTVLFLADTPYGITGPHNVGITLRGQNG